MSLSKAAKSKLTKLEPGAGKASYGSNYNAVGTITSLTESGQPVVRLESLGGNEFIAKTILQVDDADALIGSLVVVHIDHSMADVPIVIGLVGDSIVRSEPPAVPVVTNLSGSLTSDEPTLTIDGKILNLVANQELVLSCGHSSLHLHRNGKVIIKGKEVQTRASGSNKIRGATVKIN